MIHISSRCLEIFENPITDHDTVMVQHDKGLILNDILIYIYLNIPKMYVV